MVRLPRGWRPAIENNQTDAVPPIVDQDTWVTALVELREREKAPARAFLEQAVVEGVNSEV